MQSITKGVVKPVVARTPHFEDVLRYFNQKGLGEKEAYHFFIVNNMRSWKTRRGKAIENWKAAAYQWVLSAWRMNPVLFDRRLK